MWKKHLKRNYFFLFFIFYLLFIFLLALKSIILCFIKNWRLLPLSCYLWGGCFLNIIPIQVLHTNPKACISNILIHTLHCTTSINLEVHNQPTVCEPVWMLLLLAKLPLDNGSKKSLNDFPDHTKNCKKAIVAGWSEKLVNHGMYLFTALVSPQWWGSDPKLLSVSSFWSCM